LPRVGIDEMRTDASVSRPCDEWSNGAANYGIAGVDNRWLESGQFLVSFREKPIVHCVQIVDEATLHSLVCAAGTECAKRCGAERLRWNRLTAEGWRGD
jgi:hypothetical protein